MTVVIVHGLEGSSDSQYVIGTGGKAWAAGMNVVRMNMRNCGDTEHLGPTLYNSSMSAEVGAIAKTLISEDGLQKLALVGYSMGGNLVLKLLGEWGGEAPPELKAGVGVSPAMDLAPSADALHNPANRIYEWKFLQGLRRRMRRKGGTLSRDAMMSAICVACAACAILTIRLRPATRDFVMPRTITRELQPRAWWMALQYQR